MLSFGLLATLAKLAPVVHILPNRQIFLLVKNTVREVFFFYKNDKKERYIFYKLSVAGAVLQTPL